MKPAHPCAGCHYFFGTYEGNQCCNYIFLEGHMRPCLPGKDCTEHTNAGNRDFREDRNRSKRNIEVLQKTCPHCGVVFYTTRRNKEYCSRKCYEAARNHRKWEKRKLRKINGT